MANKPHKGLDDPKLENAPNLRKFIPKPDSVEAKAPNIEDANSDIDTTILRRVKVKELRRMGYDDPREIAMILDKGIKTKNGAVIQVDHKVKTIEDDLRYIAQEELSTDRGYAEKRADILDRFYFLYRRAFTDYSQERGQSKTTFLNTALNVLKIIAEMEGVMEAPKDLGRIEDNQSAETMREEVSKLNKQEREELAKTLRKFLKQSDNGEADQGSGIPSGE